ncbi:unnamed protein product [Durusdinium trenchii]|uniref:Uncharacterized protein n=1 Tax=Durusdinium trenchii TaxID=1381693 RepID=A0ABP0KTI3_9DINO
MYVTETDRKLFTFVFQVRRWPTVLEVFDMTIPAHGCVWDSDCSIRMGPYTDERNLVWDMQVVMYEGAYLRLQEYRRDEIAVPVALDPQTTCGETESGSSSDGSDSWTSDSTSDVPENNLNATGDTEEHGEGTELQQYEFSLMQYEWELEMAKDEADFLAGVRALPGASFDEVRYPEMLHLTVQKEIGDGLAIDVFQRYLRIHCPVHELSTFTVHVWIVDHEIAAFARVLPLFAGRSMTDSMRRELQHVDESESFWISALDPMPLPLSLRICPLDLVVLSAKQKKDHKRIYVVDILFRSLPRRVALIYHCGERLQDLVRRAGLQEACTPRRHHCTLSKTTTFQVKVWQLHEIVDERHGTSFELRFHDKKEAEICTPEETALMQQPASDPRAVRSIGQYLRFWNFVDREFTVWYHGNHDIKVQEHPWVLDSVSRLALRRQLQEMQIGDEDDVVPVNPPPVFVAVGRPHVLIIGGGKATKIPILCQTFYERRVNLMSILIDGSYPPLSIAAIFETAHPAHECEDSQRCYAVYENRMIPYYADVDLQEGAFIKLYRRDADDEEPSTECPSDASEVSDDSEYLVDLPYVGEQLQPQPDRDNTATLVGYSSQHLLEETARNDYVSESRLQLPDDEETMLMQHPPVERGCAQHSVAGLGKLTLLEHRVRMQRDLIYELLALRQDQFGLTPFEGALTSFWLLPGLERAAQMIEKKLLLHVVAADWTQWIEHCWEQKPEASQFYLIRMAVAYEAWDTVLDIFRIIAKGRVRLQRLLSTSLVLRWDAPEGTQFYHATQRPRIPAGAYVTMRIGEQPNGFQCRVSDERPTTSQSWDPSMTDANASHEEAEEVSYMQRPYTSHEPRLSETDAAGSTPSAPSRMTPRRALSSDGDLSATVPSGREREQLDAFGRARSFLAI